MAISDRSPVSATDPTVYPLRASRLSCPTRRPTPENWRYATYFDTVPDLTRYSSYDSLSSTEDTLNMDLDRTSVSATNRDIGIHVEKESPHGYHAGAGQTFDDKHTHSKAPEMSELEKAALEAYLTMRYHSVSDDDFIMCQRLGCYGVLPSVKHLTYHIHIHVIADSMPQRRQFQCPDCSLIFDNGNELAMHDCKARVSSPQVPHIQPSCHKSVLLAAVGKFLNSVGFGRRSARRAAP